MLPRLPRIIRLRLPRYESPVDRSNVLVLCERKDLVKRAPGGTRHVLGADDRAMQFPQPNDLGFERFRPAVVVKGNYIRLAQLNPLNLIRRFILRNIDVPNSAGQRLCGMHLPRPLERLRQQVRHARQLLGHLHLGFGIASRRIRAGFVPNIPPEDAIIFGKSANHPLHVGLQAGHLRAIRQCFRAGTLHPSGIVHTRNRRMLRPKLRTWIPARIEKHQQRSNMMMRRNRQKLI